MTTARDLRAGTVARAIRGHRLIVVLRRVEPRDRLLDLVAELCEAGARIFEITFDAPAAADDLAAVVERFGRDGVLVGAGTLVRREQLDVARQAGAQFGVAPVFDPALVADAVAAGLPFVPGAFTPTEIAAAWSAGATFVKLFPASAVGPSFVRELRGPMPEVQLIPTGGLDAANAPAFLDAGAAAVGIGGWIVRASPDERRVILAAAAGRQ